MSAASESGLFGKADVVGLAVMGMTHSGGSKASSSLGARITISCDEGVWGEENVWRSGLRETWCASAASESDSGMRSWLNESEKARCNEGGNGTLGASSWRKPSAERSPPVRLLPALLSLSMKLLRRGRGDRTGIESTGTLSLLPVSFPAALALAVDHVGLLSVATDLSDEVRECRGESR